MEELSEYLVDLGYTDDMAKAIYDDCVAYPLVNVPYAVGTLTMYELEAYAREQLGTQFDEKAFHTWILEIGPLFLRSIWMYI